MDLVDTSSKKGLRFFLFNVYKNYFFKIKKLVFDVLKVFLTFVVVTGKSIYKLLA